MQVLLYIILGLIQGLTEFLPVSSSGHLVLAEHWLKLNPPGVVTEVALHIATLASVVIYFWRDIAAFIAQRSWHYLLWLGVATAVTVALVLPAKDLLAAETDSAWAVRLCGLELLATAIWLVFVDRRLRRGYSERGHTWHSAALVGLSQGIAALPGISRSAATIGAAVYCGVSREEAARFSFLLSVPVILGAGVLTARELPAALQDGGIDPLGLALGCVASLLSGIVAIYWMLRLVKSARLTYFAVYCALLGIAALIIG